MEGTVEICYQNLWGLVLTTDWDANDAAVVCANVGYVHYGRLCIILNALMHMNDTTDIGNSDSINFI